MLEYNKPFIWPDCIIDAIQERILNQFRENTSDNAVFINTSHFEITKDLIKIIKNNKEKKFLLFSGPDWENTTCRPKPHSLFRDLDVEHIGNYNGKNYFSFWLEFVRYYQDRFDCTPTISSVPKPFMCLNRKPHDHRIYLCEQLYENDLFDYGYISLGNPDVYHTPSKILTQPILLKDDIVNKEGDDATSRAPLGITNDVSSLGNMNYWHDHFLNVVSETTIHTNVFISEKTLKPIMGYRPFVIFGDNRIYDKLHEWGIDTFDDIFGDGYRQPWYEQRAQWIVDVIRDISKNKHLNLLYKSLIPRLELNKRELLIQMNSNQELINIISKRF